MCVYYLLASYLHPGWLDHVSRIEGHTRDRHGSLFARCWDLQKSRGYGKQLCPSLLCFCVFPGRPSSLMPKISDAYVRDHRGLHSRSDSSSSCSVSLQWFTKLSLHSHVCSYTELPWRRVHSLQNIYSFLGQNISQNCLLATTPLPRVRFWRQPSFFPSWTTTKESKPFSVIHLAPLYCR